MEGLASLVELGAKRLQKAGIPEPKREASSLLQYATGRDRTFVIAHPDHIPAAEEIARYNAFVERRAGHEPFHYITGVKEFYGLDFRVSPSVLIPRPETEMIVERAVEILKGKERPRFCEVGTGSGCISIAILANVATSEAVGLEISDAAISVARENAVRHRVAERFDIRRSDVFSGLLPEERFDAVVSNPPYIPVSELAVLQPEVRDHEPIGALTDGDDGLSVIRRIVSGARDVLAPGGVLMFEFGFGQGDSIRSILSASGWESAALVDDLQGIPRIAIATL